jgi:hypothetical protein
MTSAKLNTTRASRLLMVVCVLGCSRAAVEPPSITTDQRQTIKQNLAQLGGRVTSDDSDSLYVSLRNTHIQIRSHGGVIEGAPKTGQDYIDFSRANEAIAKGFLEGNDFTAFQQWLRGALSSRSPGASRAEYGAYQLSLSGKPLRVVFSPRMDSIEK